ncbi:uncharacterized protein LOC113303488 [Papaver somniferum]|uniref:uncharacterized protein LOC113303488 n=1 Tax=Papaver somniferum TaxID=3469 RepID=UPI000E700136|nr:uncharacterized protein LOC113303488 [Papaver somniferum]
MQAARRLSFLSKNSSFSDSKKNVFYKITTAVCESNIRCSRAFAASAPSGASKRESNCKRVPLDERRGMVEAFVENYKTLNGGKFPTITEIRKQMGGSHYTIRRLVQELDHKSKTSHVSEADQQLLQTKVPKIEDQGFTKVEEITSTEPAVDLKSHELSSTVKEEPSTIIITNDVEAKVKPEVCHRAEKPLTGEAAEVKSSTVIISSDLEAKEKPQIPNYVENSLSGETVKPCDSAKEAAKSERSLGINGLKEEVVHGSDGSEEKAKSSTIIISCDLEAKEKPQIPTYVENSLSGETAKPCDSTKEAAMSERSLGINGLKEEVVHGSDGSEEKAKSSTIIISCDLEAKEKPQIPTYVENSLSGETAKPCDSTKEAAMSGRSLGINGLKEEVVHGSEEKVKSSTIIISNDVEAKEKPQVPTYVENSLSGETAKPCDTGKEAANSEGLLSSDGSTGVAQEDLEGDELSRNILSKKSKEVPNIWGKLRSFAGDVIKLWRKL